jgi:plastocyanin
MDTRAGWMVTGAPRFEYNRDIFTYPHHDGSMTTRSRLLIGIIFLVLACMAAGCASPQAAPASPAPAASPSAPGGGDAITIKNFAFSPATLAVNTGTTVTWTNKDSAPHIVVSDTGAPQAFSSESLSDGASFIFTFTQAGTYPYHCSIHPSMKGTIMVQ